MGTLSVRENIAFSAALRLPSVYTRTDRKERVRQVIEELGLTEVADSKVIITVNLFSYFINYLLGWNRVYQGYFRRRKETY